jgi:hypothetical protein
MGCAEWQSKKFPVACRPSRALLRIEAEAQVPFIERGGLKKKAANSRSKLACGRQLAVGVPCSLVFMAAAVRIFLGCPCPENSVGVASCEGGILLPYGLGCFDRKCTSAALP